MALVLGNRYFIFYGVFIICVYILQREVKNIRWSSNDDLMEIVGTGHDISEEDNLSDFDYIESIKHDCGELCDTARTGSPGKFFNYIETNVNCEAIFINPLIDRAGKFTTPPKQIPDEIFKHYSMDGILRIEYEGRYKNNYVSTNRLMTWSRDDIENNIKQAEMGILRGAYGPVATESVRDGLKHTPGVKGGRVLVIGSIEPWVEACVLEAGAAHVVTLEYGNVLSLHPQISTIKPDEFTQRYLNHTLETFDAIVSFSSIEHSGLGRYGDQLNPWGDIITIARAWCITRTGGGMLIGVPYKKDGDVLQFNEKRVYGPLRYPYLTTNWKQFYQGLGTNWQRIFVFMK